MNEKTKLLPCPFCGTAPVVKPFGDGSIFSIECEDADCNVGSQTCASSREEAAKFWNTRHSGWVGASQPTWQSGPEDAEWYYPGNCTFLKFEDGVMFEATSKNTPWRPSAMTRTVATDGSSYRRQRR